MTNKEWTWIGIGGGLIVFGAISAVILNEKKKAHHK